MARTVEDLIIEIADKYTTNKSNKQYSFQDIIEKTKRYESKQTDDWGFGKYPGWYFKGDLYCKV